MSTTNTNNNLLVELFVEELPPKALKNLGKAFAEGIFNNLLRMQLVTTGSVATDSYASPRRLGVLIKNVASQAPDRDFSEKLMPVAIGLDANNKATPALLKKLAGLGVDESVVPNLIRESDGKAEVLFYNRIIKGATLQEGLQKALEETLSKLPIPKVMTYQLADGWTSVNFVRPAHGLVALHGSDVIAITALGLTASNQTQGHRFEAKSPIVTLKDADSYAEQLKTEGAVIASFAERRAEIERQLTTAAAKQNLKPIEDDALLDEVTALVERPNVLLGQFEEIYLEVPQECLILTMKANQKYFPLLDATGKLTNKFLIVSNISPADPSAVIGGNERVVRPRLADAKFFFDQDRKKTLESRLDGLNKVVYHNKLGSQAERNSRVVKIAAAIAAKIGNADLVKKVEIAAKLSKADLITDMVGEFPELQGIMGRYYAQHEGLDDDIAFAIEDHYKPRFSGDELPRNQVGLCIALADKLETIVGMFAVGEKPSGDKDPFALKRHAIGLTRILIESNLPIDFSWLINVSIAVFPDSIVNQVYENVITDFIFDRLANAYKEQNYTSNQVEAVLGTLPLPQRLGNIPNCLVAVKKFAELEESGSLASANKRVSNILKKARDTSGAYNTSVEITDLIEPAEITLFEALKVIKPKADELFDNGDYTASLQSLAALKAPVDAFFDNVMVNADDPALKANRLGLLATLHQAMNRVADLSKLAS